ncbi:hypothetical protein PL81_31250 [Streptomyces sp. RSD-27]|nr:hypothetical protein PL81_31250 [Streptomyces sp. RSD-27]
MTPDLDRLAKVVKTRRLELYPSRLAAAQAADISKDTWRKVEEGEPVREVSYARIDSALSWATGTCVHISEGGEPVVTHLGDGPDGHSVMTTEIPPSLLPEDVRDIIRDSAMATTPNLTVREVRELQERVVAELRERGLLPKAP